MNNSIHTAVFFVGNKLEMDDGIGPAAYDAFRKTYEVGSEVGLFDVGCLSLDMIDYVRCCENIITVDAVCGTGEAPGTVFEYSPEDMARAVGPTTSLHDMKLADLFDRAALLGYECAGYCLGMQVENSSPSEFYIGLSKSCAAALPLLVETVAATLVRCGCSVKRR